jgi:hypothetical protein
VRIVERFTNFEKERIMKQDELNGDLEFTMIIGFGGKSSRC